MARRLTTAQRVQRFLRRGVTDNREIARRLGVHPESVRRLIRDPEGKQVRAMGRRHTPLPDDAVECLECGERLIVLGPHLKTHGLDSKRYRALHPGAPTSAPSFRAVRLDLYADRLGVAPGDARYWTEDRIVAAIRAWATRFGEPPAARQRFRPNARVAGWKIGSAVTAWRPSTARVVQVFGSWNGAIEAAGFRPRRAVWPPQAAAKRKRPTHCKHGHALRGKNLYVKPNGYWECRTCHRDRERRRYHERKRRA